MTDTDEESVTSVSGNGQSAYELQDAFAFVLVSIEDNMLVWLRSPLKMARRLAKDTRNQKVLASFQRLLELEIEGRKQAD